MECNSWSVAYVKCIDCHRRFRARCVAVFLGIKTLPQPSLTTNIACHTCHHYVSHEVHSCTSWLICVLVTSSCHNSSLVHASEPCCHMHWKLESTSQSIPQGWSVSHGSRSQQLCADFNITSSHYVSSFVFCPVKWAHVRVLSSLSTILSSHSLLTSLLHKDLAACSYLSHVASISSPTSCLSVFSPIKHLIHEIKLTAVFFHFVVSFHLNLNPTTLIFVMNAPNASHCRFVRQLSCTYFALILMSFRMCFRCSPSPN